MKTLIPARPQKTVGIPSISSDGTFVTAPIEWLPWMRSTSSGQILSEEGSLALPTIYACVRVLSEDVASLPLILYRRLPGGGKERATDHPLYDVLHDAPNPAMTSFTFRETMMTNLLTWGNAYAEIVYDGLGRLQLWPVRPSRVRVDWRNGAKAYTYLGNSGEKEFRPGTVFHVMGQSLDGLTGLSPIALHRETLGEQAATRDFGRSFYRNMARPATLLKHPKTLSEGAISRLAAQVDELKGTRNAGKTVVLEEGLDFAEIGIPPEQAQYVETRKMQREEAAQIYRMQQHKVGILDHATFSNIEHQQIDYVTGTLRPWLVRNEQAYKVHLFDEPDLFAEHLVDGLLRGDAKSRADALAVRWQHGTLSPNEWRNVENENPIDGGDAYYVPANYSAVNPTVDDQAVVADTGPTTDPFPTLVAVKSAALRCPDDNRLLVRAGPVGTVADCSRCKKTWTVTDAGIEEVAAAA